MSFFSELKEDVQALFSHSHKQAKEVRGKTERAKDSLTTQHKEADKLTEALRDLEASLSLDERR